MAGRWKTLSTEGGSTHVVDEDVRTTAEQLFLCAQTPHGQSTCSCGGASWAESHFGRHRSTETLETVHGDSECQCMYRVVPFFSVYIHTSSSTTANTRDRCLLPCRSTTFSRQTLSGPSGLSRLTASRAIFLIRWRARLLIVGMVLCIPPLGARLARVAGRSSLQRMRLSEFFLSLCVSFMCTFFFCARSGCGAGANVSLPTCRFLRRSITSRRHTQFARGLGGTYDAVVGRWK